MKVNYEGIKAVKKNTLTTSYLYNKAQMQSE